MNRLVPLAILLLACSCAQKERPTVWIMTIQHQYDNSDRALFMNKKGEVSDRRGTVNRLAVGCEVDERAMTEIILDYYQESPPRRDWTGSNPQIDWLAKISGNELITLGYAVEDGGIREYALKGDRLFKLDPGAISAISAIQDYACWNDVNVDGPFY